MTGFSVYFEQSKREQWRKSYLNYAELKNLLQRFAERRSRLSSVKSPDEIERFYQPVVSVQNRRNFEADDFVLLGDRNNPTDLMTSIESIDSRASQIEREEFCYVLDKELNKVASFYLDQVRDFDTKLEVLEKEVNDEKQQELHRAADDLDKEEMQEKANMLLNNFKGAYQELGQELLELNIFVAANITGLRQILIRYDSMIRTLDGPPLGQWYIVTRRGTDGKFESLFIHHGLTLMFEKLKLSLKNLQSVSDEHEVASHIASLSSSFRRLSIQNLNTSIQNMKNSLQRNNRDAEDNSSIDNAIELENGFERFIRELSSEMDKIESKLLQAEKAVDVASRGRMAFTDSLLYTLRYYFLAGLVMNDLLVQPSIIRTRGVSLKKEMKFFARWKNKHQVKFELHSTPKKKKEKDFKQYLKGPLILNLISQFLYMMNHYIVEPSSTQYIHSLGGHDALSGLLISMSPWAALLSAFVYSLWSNKSYRQPLICSGVLLVCGSLLYSSASKFSSIPLAMAGRFVSGLGAPCGINIRYIADTVPSVHRTAISAIFMTVSALGMSMGPGMAVLLDFLDFNFYLPIYGYVEVNGMTGPGYLMFILWSIYFIALILKFKDGERIGLQEMAEKEKLSNVSSQDRLMKRKQSQSSGKNSQHSSASSALSSCTSGSASFDGVDGLEIMSTKSDGEDWPHEGKKERNIPRIINQATVICMVLKFAGKFNLEVLNCSTSLVTKFRYGWSVKSIGLLGFVNGCLVIPLSAFVGFLSQFYTDQTLLLALLGVALVGVLLLLDLTDFFYIYDYEGYNYQLPSLSVGPWRYIAGQIIEFCGFQASQSVVLSMLSKVVPLSLAKGTFNSGFIATAITTLARALGDVTITVMGLASLRQLLNLLVVPCLMTTLACIALSCLYRHKLSV